MTSTPVPGFQVVPCERSEGMDRDHVFKLFHKKKVYFFQAATYEDMLRSFQLMWLQRRYVFPFEMFFLILSDYFFRWVTALDKASKAETLSP